MFRRLIPAFQQALKRHPWDWISHIVWIPALTLWFFFTLTRFGVEHYTAFIVASPVILSVFVLKEAWADRRPERGDLIADLVGAFIAVVIFLAFLA